MTQSAIYGVVVAVAVFFVGASTGMGGSLVPNLAFSALMGILAAVLFSFVTRLKRK